MFPKFKILHIPFINGVSGFANSDHLGRLVIVVRSIIPHFYCLRNICKLQIAHL